MTAKSVAPPQRGVDVESHGAASRRVDRASWLALIASVEGPPSPSVRLTLFALGSNMASNGTGARPTQALLAEQTGLSLASIKRALTRAAGDGWIARVGEQRRRGRGWRGTSYVALGPVANRVLGGVAVTLPHSCEAAAFTLSRRKASVAIDAAAMPRHPVEAANVPQS